jgi:hypothetical protein
VPWILALGLEHRLESLEAAIEELGVEVRLDAMRRRFCPPNNIVQINFEVDLHPYDELLANTRSDLTSSQEVA